MESWKFYLILTIVCLMLQSYFTMMEMAFVSFNKVRLQYYISQGNRKAIWLGRLLQRPTYLFGTTLIGVNFFLQLGSEGARMFYVNLGLSPDWAPLTQILLVLVFAELAPMFAARSHSEQTTMLGITPIYILSKLLVPFIWLLNGICRAIDWALGKSATSNHYLTREELQRAIEEGGEASRGPQQEDLDTLVQNIFEIKTKTPKELMTPISDVKVIPYNSSVKEVKQLLSHEYVPYIPLYYENKKNIFGILYTRDLLRLGDDAYIREIARSPWFITEKNSTFQILKQFRWNTQQLAIVLDELGQATGILTLNTLINEIFDNTIHVDAHRDWAPKIVIDRAFPADTLVKDINHSLELSLPYDGEDTLEDLMSHYMGRSPTKSDSVIIGRYYLTMESVPLMMERTIRITSIS